MEIAYGKQIDITSIQNLDVTLFLFARNHEKRHLTAYEHIKRNNRIKRVIALNYDKLEGEDLETKFDYENVVISNPFDISDLLEEVLKEVAGETQIKLIIDYSCMTKPWYYTIILFLKKRKLKFKNISVYFIYTPSKYADPYTPKPNRDIAPLPGKYIVPTDKPKALIVCLGYEQNKAEGIIEHLDPKTFYLLYTKPALDNDFVEKVEKNNENLLKSTNNIITFQMENLLRLERELTSLYHLLKKEYSIIIAPLGPKPFTFISMLMAIKYDDIDIWRVGSGRDINEYLREPLDPVKFLISKVEFVSNKI